jgi:hypothetical protein
MNDSRGNVRVSNRRLPLILTASTVLFQFDPVVGGLMATQKGVDS